MVVVMVSVVMFGRFGGSGDVGISGDLWTFWW